MKKISRVTWSPKAVLHFSNWIQFIAKDSLAAAERERKGLLKAVLQLKNFPQSGRIVPEFNTPSLREIIRGPIRIIFRLKGNEIHLLAFHHSRRELDMGLFS